jgi:putative transposase
MPNTYSQIYIQIVFAVKCRQNLISKNHKDEIHKFITGIIKNRSQKLIAINSVPDHIHLLISIEPDIKISDLVRDVKSGSSKFINDKKWFPGKFHWQEGYGAFSYSKSQIDQVIQYILKQEIHHQTKTFKEEYIEFLNKFDIEYNEKYLFDWIE